MATVRLVGVVENGLPRASWLPTDVRRPLALTRGVDLAVVLSAFNADGSPYEAAAGTVLALTVRPTPSSQERTLAVTGTQLPSEGDNVWRFTVSAATGRNIPAGSYAYDVTLATAGGEVETLLPTALFRIVSAPVYGG